MGSPAVEALRGANEGPQTLVTISKGFWMGQYEVTQGEYEAVMGKTNNPGVCFGLSDENPDRAVERVTWNDAMAYCTALTTNERAAGRLPAGYVYRLPTEAEWEYACRAETTTATHYGDLLQDGMANFYSFIEYDASLGNITNFNAGYFYKTIPPGQYFQNSWGLYDMHGNVSELCLDVLSTSLPGGSVTDPRGPATGPARVSRGGSYARAAAQCRSAFRGGVDPGIRYCGVGFRIVAAQP
jgi:sulfatase modifying factor 1